MNRKTTLIVVGLLFVSLAGIFLATQLYEQSRSFNGSAIEPSPPAYAFELQEAGGAAYSLEDQAGKVVLVFFGYANCPDFCPTTLTEYKRIYENLGDQVDEVEFVFITIDPERDSPQAIDEYVSAFNPDFVGLSGSEEELQPVWDGYFVFRQKEDSDSEAGYLMAHSTRIYVIDRQGQLRLTFPFGMTAEAMTSDVERLLAEQPN